MEYDELFKKREKCKKYMDNDVNIFSYHIVKLVNLYNINKFIMLYIENDKPTILKTKYNYKSYLSYLIKNFSKIKNDLNKKIKKIKKRKNYNLSLKMSVI